MRCSNCGADNPETARFCIECASPFARACPSCGTKNPPHAKFCAQCATQLSGRASPASSTALPVPARHNFKVNAAVTDGQLDGERKTVTALFADIKGSMELMEDLDPEEARAIVDPALKLMMDAVRRYDGYVVQSTGDGIFALFGAPVAHEDHPQRALYSALRMHEAMRHYGERLRADQGLNLQLRIGANIGEVVVRTIQTGTEHTEYSPIGHSTSLAARLQTLATPGCTVITESMRALVEGYFQLKGLGRTKIKGVSEPVELFEVTGLGPLRTRLQRAAGRGLTKFVGRQREMDALKHAADQTQAGHGQIVAVMADPGVGKSRLFYEFKAIEGGAQRASVAGRDACLTKWMVLEAFSVSHDKASAYLPVLDLLSAYFEISREDDDRKRRERILGKVLGLDRNLEDALPYLYSLHGISEAGDSLAQMDPQIKRRRTLEAIKRIVLRESINQPLMIIFEDLHWIDSETQALLNLLVDANANARILLLVNYRPEYRHQWGSRTHYTQLRLDPLSRETAEEMLSAMLGDDNDLVLLKHVIIERTQGTPFFMEEMLQALFEEGALQRNGAVKLARPISTIKVPSTVQAVLASRIDRLSAPEKELLQTLSVLGREFSLKLVQRVTLKSNDELDGMLAQLQLGEFINEQPAVADVEYSFKHALTQEVAYNSLVAERRRLIHTQTARAIESLYEGQLEDHYNELARHHLRGNDAAKAVYYARFEAQQAVSRAAYTEASNLVEAALKLLGQLGNEAERLNAELMLRNVESGIAFAVHGGASSEREHAIRRMCILGERIGEKEQFVSLINLCNLYFQRGEPIQADGLLKRCLELAETAGDAGSLSDAYLTATLLAMSSGKLRDAVSRYEHSQRADRTEKNSRASSRTLWIGSVGVPNETGLRTAVAMPLHLLGRIREADKMVEQNIREARQSKRLNDLALALTVAGEMHRYFRREPESALAHAEESMAISEENGLINWLHRGRFNRGWAFFELGQPAQGISEMETGMASFPKLGGSPFRQFAIARLAYAYAATERSEQGLTLLTEAVENAERTGEKITLAEILRLKGEVLFTRKLGEVEQAENCFRSALEVARAQEAKWWELRTSVSLARLLAFQRRRDEARTMLAETYNWFTEGFDLLDLQEAKRLLDELRSS